MGFLWGFRGKKTNKVFVPHIAAKWGLEPILQGFILSGKYNLTYVKEKKLHVLYTYISTRFSKINFCLTRWSL